MSVSKPAQRVRGCVWHVTGAPSVLIEYVNVRMCLIFDWALGKGDGGGGEEMGKIKMPLFLLSHVYVC